MTTNSKNSSRERRMRNLVGLLVCVLVGAVASMAPSPAHAAGGMEITSFEAGLSDYQAGGHPDAFVSFRLATTPVLDPGPSCIDFTTLDPVICQTVKGGAPKDIVVALPKGIFGNPHTIPQCTLADLSADVCPTPAQVGVQRLQLVSFGLLNGGLIPPEGEKTPIYNMTPEKGEVAKFGFRVKGAVNTFISVKVRSDGDYGLTTTVGNIFTGLPVWGTELRIWGDPYSSVHDPDRYCKGDAVVQAGFGCGAEVRSKPFMVAPAECSVDGVATLKVRSWQHSGDDDWVSRSSTPRQVTGCDRLTFTPSLALTPTTTAPDAPTGLDVDLRFPQHFDNAAGLESPPLKDATVTLPEGVSVNPSAADGLAGCADSQLRLGSLAPVACPEASKIGTVEAVTPVLSETLSGGVYLRAQNSDDPESGELFRIALMLENEDRGLSVRIPGAVKVNATTGRIQAVFSDNPQLPVSEIHVHFKAGPRAPLATPATCGTKTSAADLTSWAGQAVTRSDTFDVPCTAGLGGFSPSLSAGTTVPVAGAFAPFALSINKPDGNAAISGLSMVLPTGLLARLKGNLGTQVGSVKAFAGPGSSPFMLPGKVFLEGAYGDAPFSLRVVVPAKAGPFDLGEVVVRQKIYVDPVTAQVTVVSDPVPTIVKGVPVRLQRLDVSIDKPGFVINPTSCAAKAVGGTLKAIDGQSAPVNVRFQVGDCSLMALKPTLNLSLSGKGQTTDGKHPAVTANLTQQPGQANLKKVRVALPLSLALDPDNANGLCEFVDGSKTTPTCPKASIVGTATALTPILEEPLTGPVYFVKNIRKDPKSGREIRTLPKLVIPLVGQNGVKLTLTGTSDVVDDQLVTTFDNIPDAPVSSFKLNIIGGKGGILTVSGTDICRSTQIADQQIDGQNNKQADSDVFIQTPSCPLKVISRKVGKASVAVKIGGLGAGKVTLTGKGIRKTTKTVAKSTVATITARRTKGKPGKVTVSFDPTGPAKARKTSR
jgi:hypothetical protein